MTLKPSFVHLHHHSTYSALDGYGTPEQIVRRIRALGHPAVALTDHGNVNGHVAFVKAARAAGIKPILGLEAYVKDDHTLKGKGGLRPGLKLAHVTLLARTQAGYANLLRLVTASYRAGDLKFPAIDWDLLARHQEGLVVLSGCPVGYPTQLLLREDAQAAHEFLADLKGRVEHLFVEFVPTPTLDLCQRSMLPLMRIATDLKLPFLLTADAHWPHPKDAPAQDLLMACGMKRALDDPERMRLVGYEACSEARLLERARQTLAAAGVADPTAHDAHLLFAIYRSGKIAAACEEVEIPTAAPVRYWEFRQWEDHHANATAEQRLRGWAHAGLQERALNGFVAEELLDYERRLDAELDVLCSKGFAHYMLIVIDLVREMRSRGCVVLTRGSAGGCLVLWACGASTTDPIRHGLSFERFLDHTRDDAPDVDLDFPSARRGEALDYLAERYGRACVAHLATWNFLKARGAVTRIGQAARIPRADVQAVTGALRGDDDDVEAQLTAIDDPAARAVLERWPVLQLAPALVGQMNAQGVHAAGMLVSSEPLDGRVAVMRDESGRAVAALDKRGAAALGYLKIDCLGVEGIDVLAGALAELGEGPEFLERIPLDDPESFEGTLAHLAGVFQLDGAAAKRAGEQIGLDTFDDIVAAGSICRPGPAQFIPLYARNKRDPEAFAAHLATLHPIVADIVRPTYGVIIYQEQVMRVAREVVGLDWPDVHRLRKEVSAKAGATGDADANARWAEGWAWTFVQGCAKVGMCATEATGLWHQVRTHGGYSFNKSHCVTYALVGLWMLWLKRHHPTQFYVAYLAAETDDAKRKRLVTEFLALGGRVLPLHPRLLRARTYAPSATQPIIVGGLCDLHGIGKTQAAKILAEGPYDSWEALLLKLPAFTRYCLRASGLPDTGYITNPAMLAAVAPWYPVVTIDRAARNRRAVRRYPVVAHLADAAAEDRGNVRFLGYVTARTVAQKHASITVEDETGFVEVRVAKAKLAHLGPQLKAVAVGDLVEVEGWCPGDVVFLAECKLLTPGARSTVGRDEALIRSYSQGHVEGKPRTFPIPQALRTRLARRALATGGTLQGVIIDCLVATNLVATRRPSPGTGDHVERLADWAAGRFDRFPHASFNPSPLEAMALATCAMGLTMSWAADCQRIVEFGLNKLEENDNVK